MRLQTGRTFAWRSRQTYVNLMSSSELLPVNNECLDLSGYDILSAHQKGEHA